MGRLLWLQFVFLIGCGTRSANPNVLVPNDSIAASYRLKAGDQHDTVMMMAYIDSAILFKPNDIWARNWRADVFNAKGQKDSAYAEMKRVLASCRTPEDSATMLGNYIWDLPWMPHKEEHADWVSNFLRLTGDSGRVYSYLARVASIERASPEVIEGMLHSAIRTTVLGEHDIHRENLVNHHLFNADTNKACVEYCAMDIGNRKWLDAEMVIGCACGKLSPDTKVWTK